MTSSALAVAVNTPSTANPLKPACPSDDSNWHPCWRTKCMRGYKCVEKQVMCFTQPCYPVAECVEDNQQAL
ncbi:hypothetical protein BX661DRAFT_181796 [Kickxella alabastrina]|uniref:uncharacterized protein n=1 Tax=Kickxella alabastrina TaxID=61397 RepID=UPI00221E52EE|nr:uncharacterized protein BX661DRAFT_181796 [Kickxella alabastrina]KAI7828281.1 hypothetical protein BX661DRAFT_181796 [Kickxella alabastrina]